MILDKIALIVAVIALLISANNYYQIQDNDKANNEIFLAIEETHKEISETFQMSEAVMNSFQEFNSRTVDIFELLGVTR